MPAFVGVSVSDVDEVEVEEVKHAGESQMCVSAVLDLLDVDE